MHSRLKFLKSFCHLGNQRIAADVRCLSRWESLSCNSFCTVVKSVQVDDPFQVTESPGLPDWVTSSSSNGASLHSSSEKDDFVLPSLTNWIEGYRVRTPEVHPEQEAEIESGNEVDQISKFLKNQFDSPEAVVESLSQCSVELNDDVVNKILERFSFEWVPCIGFFSWAKLERGFNFSPESYNQMVDILGKAKKFDLMFELVEEMKNLDGYITNITISKVLRRMSKAGKPEDAINVFRNLEQYGLSKDTKCMNILLDSLIKLRHIEFAVKVYQEFEDAIPPNGYTFNILAHGWCIVRKMEKAKEIVVEMKKHGFQPDAVTCTSFIEAHCREKDFRKVDEMLKYMEQNKLVPSVVTYTIIVAALGKAKELGRALEMYERMKREGCFPDCAFYSCLITVLSKSGREKDALAVFMDMGKQGVNPDTITYNTMIVAAVKEHREEDALKLLKRMEETGCKPDLETYVPLMKMCCRLKRMTVLSFLLNHMYTNNVSMNLGMYSLLVNGLCASGNVERAFVFYEESVKKGFLPMDSMRHKLVKGFDKKGMVKEIERVEELMQHAKLQNAAQVSSDSSDSFAQV